MRTMIDDDKVVVVVVVVVPTEIRYQYKLCSYIWFVFRCLADGGCYLYLDIKTDGEGMACVQALVVP